MRSGGTAKASRNPRSAWLASAAGPAGSNPRRLTYSCPPGKCAATRCAQCTARVVLPTPAVPAMTEMAAPSSGPGTIASRLASSAPRPAKAATGGGSWAGSNAAAGCSAGRTRRQDAGAGASSDESWRRIAVSRSRSAWPGTSPSSSARVLRSRW